MVARRHRLTSARLALAAVAAAVAALALPGAAAAQPGAPVPAAEATPAAQLQRAADRLARGDHAGAAAVAGAIAQRPDRLEPADRAEAWRIYGLALFFLGRRADAEAALLRYLALDIDAHLDPVLVPPEAIVFFEDVRARHAAELRASRPPPRRRRRAVLNLLPPLGQFQNGDRAKGWTIAATGGLLLAAHVTTYWTLRSWCADDRTCGAGRTDTARAVRVVNLTTGVGVLAVYTYGAIDGFIRHRRRASAELAGDAPDAGFTIAPHGDGALLLFGGTF
jgi:hypothetical protein